MNKLLHFTMLPLLIVLALAACQPVASRVISTPEPPTLMPTAQIQPVQRETQAPTVEVQPSKTEPVGGEPSQTPEAGKLKTFSSSLYGYEVSYPADWQIQVNHPAGAGKDPEYLTLKPGDASNLPQIDVWVLTGQAPVSGYENCEANFVFRGLPACHLSLAGGQNPPAELWIFQKGSANFYIRMIYQDKSAMQLFDDFLSSFTFTQ